MKESTTITKQRVAPRAPEVSDMMVNTSTWPFDSGLHSPHSGVHNLRSDVSSIKNPSLQFLSSATPYVQLEAVINAWWIV